MMRIRLPGIIAAAALAAWFAHGDPANAEERIYVLSQNGATLSETEDGGGTAASAIALDKAPAALALAPDSARAYVTHPDLGRVSVVDLAARRVVGTMSVPGSPFGIAAAKGGRLYVGDWNGDHVVVLEADDPAASKTVHVGRAPAHVLLSPDESMLFVANRESDSVSAVRTGDFTLAATIPVGRAPFAMALSSDAARLYVGNVQSGTVSVIDTSSLTVIETRKSGAMPYGVAVTPDGSRVLVTNQQAGTVAVLAGNGDPPHAIRVGGYPEGIAVSTDGARAYVANWFSDDVSVLDLESLREIRKIKSAAGPRAIVIRPK